MKNCVIFVCCALLAFSTGCDQSVSDDGGDQEQETEETDRPGDSTDDETEIASVDGDYDLDSMIDAQQGRINEAACDRPIQCMQESDDYEVPDGYTAEDCYERHGLPDGAREFMATQPEGTVETCLEKGAAVTDCLNEASCDEAVAWSHPQVDTGVDTSQESICAAEMREQMEACDFLIEWQRRQQRSDEAGPESR